MPWWFAALFGVVQGLTEFIPVSSTAHLRILPSLFGLPDYGPAYTAVIQLGTLLAVLVYFAKDLGRLAVAMVKEPSTFEGQLPWMIAVGTVPIVIAGLTLKKYIHNDLRSLFVIAGALILIGVVMIVIERHVAGRPDRRPLSAMTYRDAILVGLAQTLALVPGVSRSGATICAILLLGFTRSDAARFSFLLSIPAIAGAGLFEARDAVHVLGRSALPALAIGITTAAVSGYLAISWLIRWLGSHDMVGFAVYRVAIGVALLVALFGRVLKPF